MLIKFDLSYITENGKIKEYLNFKEYSMFVENLTITADLIENFTLTLSNFSETCKYAFKYNNKYSKIERNIIRFKNHIDSQKSRHNNYFFNMLRMYDYNTKKFKVVTALIFNSSDYLLELTENYNETIELYEQACLDSENIFRNAVGVDLDDDWCGFAGIFPDLGIDKLECLEDGTFNNIRYILENWKITSFNTHYTLERLPNSNGSLPEIVQRKFPELFI